ncbi:WD40-repeat-containing domain protein [Mycena pura]|uniref:WD40-repeat-containing domain protein n=1 Tax=Mycena pura TaxID=153505 RepID=A0AAD6VB95_9AGAR|nr:WD40-repeat-containing domain protein [Mycena pura]
MSDQMRSLCQNDVGKDQVFKGEYRVISGRINDLEWDGESKRIIAVGDGREKFEHAFMMDSGSSTGEISGHAKVINAVSIRHQRPFRGATSGNGNVHKFVQDLRYAPSGEHFTSVGSDSKVFLYDGKTGETISEFTDNPHKGGITACSSSADCTVKLWDVETHKAMITWSLDSGVNNQQVGNVWTREADIGLQKSITAVAPSSTGTFLAGTADGRMVEYTAASCHIVVGLAAGSSGMVFSAGYDDRVREIGAGRPSASFSDASIATASQPKRGRHIVVESGGGVEAIRNNRKVAHLPATNFTPSTVGMSAGGKLVAIGGEDHKVRLYEWSGTAFTEAGLLEGNKACN